jgi:hypothetical protein
LVELSKFNSYTDGGHKYFLMIFSYLYSKKTIMTFIATQPRTTYQYHSATKRSLLSKFNAWATKEESDYHVAWVGASIIAMAAVFFPLTMTAILLNGAVFGLIIAAMASLSVVVITNLAAMPVKLTIPFFLLGVIADVAIITASFFIK